MAGRSPLGSGLRPFGTEPQASQPEALVPNADEAILSIIRNVLEPMQYSGVGWSTFYKMMRAAPEAIVGRIRDSNIMFRRVEQADWPVVADVLDCDPHGFERDVGLQVTIGGQLFGAVQRVPAHYLADQDFVMNLGRQMTRHAIAHAAQPFEEESFLQIAKAIEARSAETRSKARPVGRKRGAKHSPESPSDA